MTFSSTKAMRRIAGPEILTCDGCVRMTRRLTTSQAHSVIKIHDVRLPEFYINTFRTRAVTPSCHSNARSSSLLILISSSRMLILSTTAGTDSTISMRPHSRLVPGCCICPFPWASDGVTSIPYGNSGASSPAIRSSTAGDQSSSPIASSDVADGVVARAVG